MASDFSSILINQPTTVDLYIRKLNATETITNEVVTQYLETDQIAPYTSGGTIGIDTNISLNGYALSDALDVQVTNLQNVQTFSVFNGSTGTPGQVLGLNSNSHLAWLVNGGGGPTYDTIQGNLSVNPSCCK